MSGSRQADCQTPTIFAVSQRSQPLLEYRGGRRPQRNKHTPTTTASSLQNLLRAAQGTQAGARMLRGVQGLVQGQYRRSGGRFLAADGDSEV